MEEAGSRGEGGLTKEALSFPGSPPCPIVPAPLLRAVTGWIARHRRRPGAPPWQRAATVHAQVCLVLRWLRHRAEVHTLARAAVVSDATAYGSCTRA